MRLSIAVPLIVNHVSIQLYVLSHARRVRAMTIGKSLTILCASALLGCRDEPVSPRDVVIVARQTQVTLSGVGASVHVPVDVVSGSGRTLPGATLTWASHDPAVATVIGTTAGVTITAMAMGSTIVSGKTGSASAEIAVRVQPVPVASVDVSVGNTTLVVGQVTPATATPRDVAGVALDGRVSGWTSSRPSVAAVHPTTGLVTAISPGTAVVTATIEGIAGSSATLTVLPLPNSLTSFEVTPAQGVLSGAGGTLTLTTTAIASVGVLVTYANSSSNPLVATVTQGTSPTVTAVGVGSTVISIAATGAGPGYATITIIRTATVSVPAVATVLVTIPASTLAVGQTVQAIAIPKDAAGAALTARVSRWSSSNAASVSVQQNSGLVTAVAAGTAVITATIEGITGNTGSLTVSPLPNALVSFVVTPETVSATGPGVTQSLTMTTVLAPVAFVSYANSTSSAAVATVSAGVNPTITVTGVGTALITTIATASGLGVSTNAITRTVSVNVPSVSNVLVSLTATTVAVGGATQATAVPTDNSGTALTGRPRTDWTSSNVAVATVHPTSGIVSGIADGTATFSTSIEGVTGTSAAITVQAAPSITVSASAAAAVPGGTATSTVAIGRIHFPGPVVLTLVNPPSGITGSFAPASTTGSSATLTIAVAAQVATGVYALALKGSGVGVGDQTALLSLTITAAPAIALSATPVTIEAGSSSASTITISRTNFSNSISLTLVSPPAGITGVFAPAAVTGTTALLTLSVAASVAPTTYILSVRAAGSGVADQSTAVTVIVTTASSISMALSASTVLAPPGGSATSTASLARTNFAGSVTFSALGLPVGMSISFSPASTTLSTTTLTVAVTGAVPTGTYAVSIRATGTGVSATTPLQVAVTFVGIGPSVARTSGRQLLVRRRLLDASLTSETAVELKCVAYSPASVSTASGDPNIRRLEYALWSRTDIPLMKAMNVNCVRLFIDPGFDAALGPKGIEMLDKFYAAEIMVIMTVDDGSNNPTRVQQVVSYYRNHPAVLLWMLGNEWNIRASFCASGSAVVYYGCTAASITTAAQLIEASAILIKSLDTNHPVSSSYGEIDINADFQRLADTQGYLSIASHVDCWGLQIYRGASFGSLFTQWESISTKPMFLSEFGTDAYDNRIGAINEPMQAQWDLDLWTEIYKNLSAKNPSKVALGGAIFSWVDEYWKAGNIGVQDVSGCGPPDCGGHPDAFSNEEIYGICRIDRSCRAVYTVMKSAFDPSFVPGPTSAAFSAVSRGSNVPESGNGWASFERNGGSFYFRGGGAGGGRGFNIAVINPANGAELQPSRNFDTWSTRTTGTEMDAMVAYLNTIPQNTLILIAVGDDAGINSDAACTKFSFPWVARGIQALEALGSTRISSYCFRDSWAMVAFKGGGARSEQRGVAVEARAQWTVIIP